jgi:hypothetical protein
MNSRRACLAATVACLAPIFVNFAGLVAAATAAISGLLVGGLEQHRGAA